MNPSPAEVTVLLRAWSAGDQTAHDKLWPIVFAELKRLARRQMARERPDHTLQSSALVNEAYVRLIDWNNAGWESRAHFFAMCARIMRQILIDHARSRRSRKRPGHAQRVSLNEVLIISDSKGEELLALDEALKKLAEIHPRKSDVVEMRFFGGLSVEETAEALKISRLTVIRDWNFARAWLRALVSGEKFDEE
ncbi:MAG TPA: sigma-70 family RNA polymerase sigma factor [Terriglobia bacterium]|nr:sigma-70 family RNA polymerase sigma factor [Terriglobia bacterium]